MVDNLLTHSGQGCSGNSFHLLKDGSSFYPEMRASIRAAHSYVLMEMYLVESGEVADLFISDFVAAAQRGVTVLLLLDAFGSRLFDSKSRDQLDRGGVQLAFYNPLRWRRFKKNLMRTHRKFMIVDGEVVFVGGSGISDRFLGECGWRETMVKVRGLVIEDWKSLFFDNWRDWSSYPVPVASPINRSQQNQKGRIAWTSGGNTQLEIKRTLINRTRHATQRVWVASAYFLPSRKLRRVLRQAASRGVDTRILLPGPITDHPAVRFASRRFYARLLRYGVRIYEYQGRFMHSKIGLIDDWCSIGSSNLDRWNFRWNLEANQEIDDKKFSSEVGEMLEMDFGFSEEIIAWQWKQRSVLHHLLEWMWGKIDILLSHWMPSGSAKEDKKTAAPENQRHHDRFTK